MHEDKQLICNKFCDALKITRQYNDLLKLEYVDDGPSCSHVTAYFTGGTLDINTSMDSGWAMIKDIVQRLPLA